MWKPQLGSSPFLPSQKWKLRHRAVRTWPRSPSALMTQLELEPRSSAHQLRILLLFSRPLASYRDWEPWIVGPFSWVLIPQPSQLDVWLPPRPASSGWSAAVTTDSMLHSCQPRASGHRRQRAGRRRYLEQMPGEGDRRMPMAVREKRWDGGAGPDEKAQTKKRSAGRETGWARHQGRPRCSKGRPGVSVPSPHSHSSPAQSLTVQLERRGERHYMEHKHQDRLLFLLQEPTEVLRHTEHHKSETTQDRGNNPWGPCGWSAASTSEIPWSDSGDGVQYRS